MADLTAVRAELAAKLQAAMPTWHVYPYVPELPALPALCVGFVESIQYGFNIAGHARIQLAVTAVAGQVSDKAAQDALDTALGTGAGSIPAALDGATGTAWKGHVRLVDAGDLRAATVGNAPVLVADVTLELLA